MRSMAEDQIHWIFNNGSADFWFDNWLGTGALFRRVDVSANHCVRDFLAGPIALAVASPLGY